MILNDKLEDLKLQGKNINIAVIGAGLMGTGMVSQLSLVSGMKPALVIDRTLEKAVNAFLRAGIHKSDIHIGRGIADIEEAIGRGKFVAYDNLELGARAGNIDVVVDATGNPEAGGKIALSSIENGKHIVMLNVETDMVVGPILYEKARKQNLIYTGTAGDEPGSAKEIYDFARLVGFDIIAMGKGKNNPINHSVTPAMVEEEARRKNLKPSMLAGFIDGTNTMIEMTVMANATGFVPDIRGGHGISAEVDQLPDIFRLREDGGILSRTGVVDYVNGIAPGVFVIVSSKLPQVHSQMEFLKMGSGPNYVLYRPYHLTSLETPISIARAVLESSATIAPTKGQVCDTITVAKRDLKAGERLDGIGKNTVYGTIEIHENTIENNYLPIGLVNENTIVKKDIKKGELITRDSVDLDKETLLYKLREELEENLSNRG